MHFRPLLDQRPATGTRTRLELWHEQGIRPGHLRARTFPSRLAARHPAKIALDRRYRVPGHHEPWLEQQGPAQLLPLARPPGPDRLPAELPGQPVVPGVAGHVADHGDFPRRLALPFDPVRQRIAVDPALAQRFFADQPAVPAWLVRDPLLRHRRRPAVGAANDVEQLRQLLRQCARPAPGHGNG
ncbi:hypothetical protein D3C85_1204820 [compost metagenome]